MRIDYNVRGEQRKSLAAAISQELQIPALYQGVPSFHYEIGGLSLDKNGVLEGTDNRELVADLQGLHGFIPASEEYEDSPEWHDTCDREDRDEYGNWDGNEMPYYREPRHTEEEFGLGVHRADPAGENGMQASDVPETEETNRLVVEIPLDGFTSEKLDNLFKMVNSKSTLLKAALGIDSLPIQVGEDTIRFPWFNGNLDGAHVKAYSELVSLICNTAKEKKRVTAKAKETEGSQKYAFRCYLISLGFIGDEYKESRKVLLSNLEGSPAYKTPKKEDVQ
jgi:hypothetical protein